MTVWRRPSENFYSRRQFGYPCLGEIAADRGSIEGSGAMQLSFARKCAFGSLIVMASLSAFLPGAKADTKIVAVGASNTSGFGAGVGQSYPSQLEAMLKAHGYKVQVINAGVLGDTTRGMLARIDTAVPADTRIVILQPGGNDLRFGVPAAERAKNISAMMAKLQKRGIRVIVADNLQGLLVGHSIDGIHFNGDAHAMIAKKLYPQVVSALGGPAANGQPAAALPAGAQPAQTPASTGAAH
jgi:acyl-CoA thioesterase-1